MINDDQFLLAGAAMIAALAIVFVTMVLLT